MQFVEPGGQVGLAPETDAVAIAVAGVLHGAELGEAREDVLPDVLHDAAAHLVVERRAHQPVAVHDVPAHGVTTDALAADGELCAAGLGQCGWDGVEWVQLRPDLGGEVSLFFALEVVVIGFRTVEVDPIRTARVAVAAGGKVAGAHDTLAGEAPDG